MANRDNVHGEGNYEASRKYNQATKEFVESGRVEDAARDAAPHDASEAREMEAAEQQGKQRAKEEDPALRKGADTDASRSGDRTTDPTQSQQPMPGKE